MARTTSSINRLMGRYKARQVRKQDHRHEGINWDEMHQKIIDSTAKTTWVEDLPVEQLTEAWARRAVQLAQKVEVKDKGEQVELAIIRLGREIYGLDVRFLFDIRPLTHLTQVPRTPAWVAGVVNLRGRIISVLDLQRYLNLPGSDSKGSQFTERQMAVVETPDMELAILVDEVQSMETIPVTKIQEATSAVRGIRLEYVQGVVVYDQSSNSSMGSNNGHGIQENSMLVILNLPALLADSRLIIHEELV